MASSDLVYCDHCGGASPPGSAACRFCGAALPPPRPASGRSAVQAPTAAVPPASDPGGDDPWADLHEPAAATPEADDEHGEPWGDPNRLPWRSDPDAGGELPPTQVGAWQAASSVPPVYGAEPVYGGEPVEGEPTMVHTQWDDGALIEPGADGPRRGMPGWAWVATVVLLGTILGIGAYIVVDKADDDSVRTDESSTTSTSSTTSSTTTSTTSTTVPPTTVPVVPATPPVTAPETSPPTVPGAVTVPTTLPPTTVPTTPPPTTPAPTTAAPTTTPTTTAAPTTPAPTAPSGTVPGDLGIPGIPMTQPPCDGKYVTFLASAKNTTGPAMQEALESFPGSHYLRTDQTCPSLNSPASDGTPLYRIYVGPYADAAEACAARAQGTQGSFVKRLSDEPPTHVVTCPDAPA